MSPQDVTFEESASGTSCLIAVTGGIGSGKSVVSRMLRCMGYAVYDCDSEARRLMDADEEIKREISTNICRDAIAADGSINRAALAEAVFADGMLLERLNAAVHATVRRDLLRWSAEHNPAFVETAILYQSGLDRMVCEVWQVDAPAELRIRRVMARNNMSRNHVEQRIEAQDSYNAGRAHDAVRHVLNDGDQPLLPRLLELLDGLSAR